MSKGAVMSRATLTQQVYEEIKRRILDGDLPGGRRLNETELAGDLGVSPTPVREALRKLHGDGLISHSAWQGTTVITLDLRDITHLHEIRSALECLAVREAAARLTSGDLDEVSELLRRAPDAIARADARLLHSLNEDFHRFFHIRSENRWLEQMIGALNDLLVLARRPLTAQRSGREAWDEHERIVAALRTGDVAGAEAAMAAHIDRVRSELIAQLDAERRE